MKKQCQFYLDFEGSSRNSHFRAMTALYFFQHLVQMGTFQHYFSLTNESYFAKLIYLLLTCEFLSTFYSVFAYSVGHYFSCPKTTTFHTPKNVYHVSI